VPAASEPTIRRSGRRSSRRWSTRCRRHRASGVSASPDRGRDGVSGLPAGFGCRIRWQQRRGLGWG
jgi:hypothetical protein